MENNNYENNGTNNYTGGSANSSAENSSDMNSVNHAASSADYNSNQNAGTVNSGSQNAGTGSSEGSSTYGYSYINQEQKNPNNVWRAEENSYQGGYSSQSSQIGYGQTGYGQGGAQTGYQGNSQSGQSQNAQAGSNYSNIYGNAGWSTYTDERQKKKENRAQRRAQRREQRKAQGGNAGFGIKIAKCASIALVFGLVAGTAFEGSSYLMGNVLGTNQQEETADAPHEDKEILNSSTTNRTHASQLSATKSGTDVASIAQECMPSIVAITNMSEVQYQNWFGQMQKYENQSAGSGIIISEDNEYLYIATNNHVVESATTLTIQFCDDSTAGAEVKGTDASSDLAVVKVKKADIQADTLSTIKVATLGDSDALQVGSEAIAIGNALGYGQSVTTGVISALNREVTIQDEMTGETFTNDLIQTDAAINPGNSGGALLNSNGEVIGINSSKYSDTTVEGMGFAIPSNMAKPIIEDLIVREVVSEDKQAFLGVSGVDVSSSVASTYNIPEGVYIAEVTSGTAADKAGLQKGDIITKFDGKKVNSFDALRNMMTYYEAGSEVEVTIARIGEGGYQEMVINVTLGNKNS